MPIRRLATIALTAATLTTSSAAMAATSSIFVARGKSSVTPAIAKTDTSVAGRVDTTALLQPRLKLTLPDGREVIAQQKHFKRKAGQTTWTGSFRESPDDQLVVTALNGVVAGTLSYRGKRFELRAQPSGDSLLFEVDRAKLPQQQDLALSVPDRESRTLRSKTQVMPASATSATPVVQDLVVMVTAAGSSSYGSGLNSAIANAIEQANTAYRDGGVGIRINLVAVVSSGLVESAGMTETLYAFRQDASAQIVREQYGADLMLLINANTNYCGVAFKLDSPDAGFAPWAYGTVSYLCVDGITVAHEIGHMQGLSHDRETAGTGATASFPYAFGYRNCSSGARDIMSYPCTSGSAYAINRFSDPHHLVNGVPFGVEFELNPTQAADAVRALNNTAGVVAAFRQSLTLAPPTRPSNLALAIEGESQVRLNWHDDSTDEAGFAVARSSDGVTWQEIALLGAGSTTFVDATAALGAYYSYRVTAFNAAGSSTASNIASITVALPPPPSPLGVAATNGRNLTATISWNAVVSARSYEVRRESWAKVTTQYQLPNGKTKRKKAFQWTGLRTVGTVPASVGLSMVDASGVGRFRYSVRAVNLSGPGEWSTAAEVTVTKK